MKEFLDQPKEDYRIAKDAKTNLFGKENPPKDEKPKTDEEIKIIYEKLFKQINIGNYQPEQLRRNLEAAIKFWEGEIEDFRNEGNDELTLKSIEDRKKKILNNSLWITKIDDFLLNHQINIDGSSFNEN